jgi:hypothetical protein
MMQRCVLYRTVRARAALAMMRALMQIKTRSAAKLMGCRCITSVQRACMPHSRDPPSIRGNCIAPKFHHLVAGLMAAATRLLDSEQVRIVQS